MTIPNSITTIESYAFSFSFNGSNRSISLPNSVTTIAEKAFYRCGATSITLPNNSNFTTINNNTFENCLSLGVVTIPNSVTTIGNYAFWRCRSMASITVPDSVSSIGTGAFIECSGFSSATLPTNQNFTAIENNLFELCSALTSITIPGSVTTIGNNAFSGTGISSITFPSSVTTIGNNAFNSCPNLSTISMTNFITTIGTGAFQSCIALQSIILPNGIATIGTDTFRSCGLLSSVTIPSSVITMGNSVFQSCTSLESITIPNSVTTIGNSVFQSCTSLESIIIPDSVTSIGTSAFSGCSNLASIIFPNNSSFISINASLCSSCTSLVEISIPNSITSIGNNSFQSCTSLVGISIPNSVTSIGNNSFQGCSSLLSIPLPNSLVTIGNEAYKNCSAILSAIVPISVTSIGNNVFESCTSLSVITFFGEDPIQFGTNVFLNLPQFIILSENLVVPSGIPNATYLEFVNMSDTVIVSNGNNISLSTDTPFPSSSNKTVREHSFIKYLSEHVDNISSKTIEIDNNIFQFIEGTNAPSDATPLSSVKLIIQHPNFSEHESPTFDCSNGSHYIIIGDNVSVTLTVSGTSKTIKKLSENIYVENDVQYTTGSTIKIGSKNVKFGSIIVYTQNLTTFDNIIYLYSDSDFYAHIFGNTLTGSGLSITIPQTINVESDQYTVTSIDDYSFLNCNALEEIVISDSVVSIGVESFRNCQNLSSITIPDSVTNIGNGAFSKCESLTSIVIPISITAINNEVFAECYGLTDITLPSALSSIGNNSFQSCTSLSNIEIPDTVQHIGEYTFLLCSSLLSIIIPNSVETIGAHTFEQCSALTTVQLSNSMTEISNYLFNTASVLSQVFIPSSITKIGNSSFCLCNALTSINIPNSVTIIDDYAFSESGIQSILLPKSLATMGNDVFSYCESLTYVVFFGDDSITIGDDVFMGSQVKLLCEGGDQTTILSRNIPNAAYLSFDNLSDISMITNGNNIHLSLGYDKLSSSDSIITNIGELSLVQYILKNISDITTKNIYVDNKIINYMEKNNAPIDMYIGDVELKFQFPVIHSTTSPNTLSVNFANISYYIIIANTMSVAINVINIVDDSISKVIYITKGNNLTYRTIDDSVMTIKNVGDEIILGRTASYGFRKIKFGSILLYDSVPDGNICVGESSVVRTDQGPVKITDISTHINTIRGKKIVAVTKVKYVGDHLYNIKKDAFGKNMPDIDTIITGDHGIYVNNLSNNKMEMVKNIRNTNITTIKYGGEYLYNILMEKHGKMSVNNIVVETLNPENKIAKFYLY